MKSSKRFGVRAARSKRGAIVALLALVFSPSVGIPITPTVHAQTQVAPVGNGFVLDAGDLRFIYEQILVAQAHAAGGQLLGPGPNQVHDPQLPRGLRTVDGSFNNLVPAPLAGVVLQPGETDQTKFGAADRRFPRLTTPVYRTAEPSPADPTGPPTSYTQKLLNNVVYDSQPRIISNLIVDQSMGNPAAVAAAKNPCGSGGFVCSPPELDQNGNPPTDPASGALFIPNITPDFGLSAPFNVWFAFFGQFFDHGLDLVNKGGGLVIMPLKDDDPLINGPDGIPNTPDDIPPSQRFMVMTRGQNLPGPDGILGTADDIQEGVNQTTPWVDQNQTYTSHPSHQVFLREYKLVDNPAFPGTQKPAQTGKVLDGGFCADRPTGIPGDRICNIGNWAEVKAQASTMLGIKLTDPDVLNVPLLLTDPYGHFKPGPHGFPQLVLPGNVLLEGNPTGGGVDIPAEAFRTGHAFLNDIAHNAVPLDSMGAPLAPDADTDICNFRTCVQPAGTYDNELLDRHFITGDGRGNENIGLTTVHQLFHSEHNRLRYYIDDLIYTKIPLCANDIVGHPILTDNCLTQAEKNAWGKGQPNEGLDPASGWDYGERLFQAARFGTEMQYQHLVFEEFARTIQPLINPFLGGLTNIDPAISAEFAHTVYRLGHSMLPERLDRINVDPVTHNETTDNEIRLFDAFLNPLEFNNGGPAGTLSAPAAAGAIIRGLTRQVGNELDEFVTSSVRNTLVGLPQDLPAINIARGRSEGIPPLNEVRRQFFNQSHDPTLQPYASWFEFSLALRHMESWANFVAAYGTHPSITNATTVADKRAAALALVGVFPPGPPDPWLFSEPPATSGLNNVDFWVGGLAEKPSVFGGLLGSTFNVVFEKQLEHLQDGDRFYYLQRTDGLNLRQQLEGNSFAELIRRNTDIGATMDVIFKFADHRFDDTTVAQSFADGTSVIVLPNGTKMFFDPLHSGKNIVVNGGSGDDHWIGDVGDDTMFGNGGNDRLEGGEGNDTLIGGDGDDILLGGNGDDVLKGGPGNDALQSGPGFGGDILIGGDGNDFLVGGDDGVEYFAGPGNDIIVDGAMRAEAIFGGSGDDWIDDGEGHDGGIFGDDGNLFDLLAGLSAIGGDDVLGGGPGQDNHFGEGGNDIFLMSEGSNKFFGDFGFDWITLRGWPAPEFIELSLLALPNVPVNFNDLRNKYRFVDGASGWDLDDHIAGSNGVLCNPPGEVAECLVVGMELTVEGASKFAGLQNLVENGFGKSLSDPAIPLVKGVGFMGGDILLGGKGNDTLEGKAGDDLIEGDAWLNVQLKATYNDGHIRFVDGPRDLVDDVFSDPQRLNPGKIDIVRTIVDPYRDPTDPPDSRPLRPAGDCTATVPVNCDTAVFNFPKAEYVITQNANGTTTVQHVPPLPRAPGLAEGTDILRHMERARFTEADGTFSFVDLTRPLNSVATGSVTISDTTPTEDQVLTATFSITDGNGFNPALVSLEWQAETAVPGVFAAVATQPSFAPGNPEVGHRLRVAVRFTDGAGFAESVLSDPTAPVININNPPTGAPTLSTTAPQKAEALSANPAGIVDLDGLVGVSFSFQWLQSAVGGGAPFNAIPGATAAAFTPAQAQVNRQLRVRVTYTDNHGTAEAIPSANTDVVGDVIVGTAADETLTGTAGRDNLQGRAGADLINAGAGNDTITGGNGNDTINAGPGDDVILVGLNDGFDDVGGGAGNDEIRATANGVQIGLSALAGVESITANGFTGVTIATPNAATTLDFSAVTLTGIVSINGGNGNDTITGSAAADVINGGAGDDTINGGPGADIITGGPGNDTMNGGGGQNIFKFAAGSGVDRIISFNTTNDKLDISARGITSANFATRVAVTTVGGDTLITFTGTTPTESIRLVGITVTAAVVKAACILAP